MSYQFNRQSKFLGGRGRTQQEGIVIIMALFIVALVAAMAVNMMSRLSRDTSQTTLLIRNVEATNYARGSVAWAMDTLINNVKNKKPDTIMDAIPIKSPVNTVNEYKISSTIYDLQSRFNINDLTDPKYQPRFYRLIRLVAPKVTQAQAQEILKATIDWIAPKNVNNSYNKYYLSLPQPYRAAHRQMLNASELKLVKGMTPAIYTALQPYIVALPPVTKINFMTAPAPVLAALSDKVALVEAAQIVKVRAENPAKAKQRIYTLDVIKSGRFPVADVDTESKYFLVETKVSIDGDDFLLYTQLSRDAQNGQASVIITGQTKGSW